MNRKEYADLIVKRISSYQDDLHREFSREGRIPSCMVDDLLEESLAREIHDAFPKKEEMVFKNSWRERKYIAVQMNRYPPLLEEIIYSFQDPRVIGLLSAITGLNDLIPDENLYAGGISLMGKGDYLNPHLDNSHGHDRKNYRVLNLLYYITPDWQESYGGHLELWDQGVKKPPRVIESRFNRLVIMATGEASWHSVNQVVQDGERSCVSNYYFSPQSLEKEDYFHVTSFRGRPEQKLLDFILHADAFLRNGVRRIFKKGIVKTTHIYHRKA